MVTTEEILPYILLLKWEAIGQFKSCGTIAALELLQKSNSHKDTALHYAIRGGHHRVVKLLIEEDPQLCSVNNAANESPLYPATNRGLSHTAELILGAFSSLSSHKGPKGLTTLHTAMYCSLTTFRGHVDVIDELVRSCHASCDIINSKGQTILHAAVINGQVNAVKYITRTPNLEDLVNKQDTDGNTALHLAELHKQYNIYILARDKRVDRLVTNKDHLTALDGFTAHKERPIRYLFQVSIIGLQLLVAVLIATVTFAAVFKLPGGYNRDGPDQGLAILAGRAAFSSGSLSLRGALTCLGCGEPSAHVSLDQE
ncbi:hypothetical protein EUGRSUZ_D01231 [Eucalyptus grandis]|uniref:Uncharacterized protein n=2 Tax=Eucalyptus grandis TaxID=71139 RepID=A0ACC3L5D3_EUCGR|nr:hypothetical protein EUGRSUZ_D01231 [Eucalyptus grandis]